MSNLPDSINKLERQIEILGLCLSKKDKYEKYDLADIFNCETQTIKRDLKDLRSYGVDIHSSGKKGILIGTEINPEIISSLITQYFSFIFSDLAFDKSIINLTKKREQGLVDIVLLNRAINMIDDIVVL